MPKVVVIAGPNGAGKSTTAPAILRDALEVHEFVNADTIAAGLSAFSPESVALAAGRIMLDRVHELARERRDFAFETTLASRTFAPWIKRLQAEGYTFHLV
jgi:predicted ABC-type ATPase